MGICMSSGDVSGAAAAAARGVEVASTAMVLLPTGEMRDYPRPATAARALEEGAGSTGKWFLCDANVMGFEGPVAAVDGAQELWPGRIYFVPPYEARRNGLRREEVAALAVSASAALVKKAGAGGGCNSSRQRRSRAGSVASLVFAWAGDAGEFTLRSDRVGW